MRQDFQPIKTKRSIYGFVNEIAGAILLTDESTGKQKYFIVAKESEDGGYHVRLSSDFNISQKQASQLPQIQDSTAQYCEFRRFAKVFWRTQF
jgi:hypothetical protein